MQGRHTLILSYLLVALPTLLIISGCATTAATQVVGAAVSVAMQTAGLIKKTDADAPRPVAVTLAAGNVINSTESGQSLSLVVRLYQLRNASAFSMLSYDQARDAEREKAVLAEDLVAVRELTLIPGKTYQLEEKVSADVEVIGVVGLFRAPAANRWKLAFNREASEDAGISVGFHGCAMTVGMGELNNAAATNASRSLAGVHCY